MIWKSFPRDFEGDHAYFWFQTWQMHHPVVVRVNKGVTRTQGGGYEEELNYEPPQTSLRFIWQSSSQWPEARWAGPLVRPPESLDRLLTSDGQGRVTGELH